MSVSNVNIGQLRAMPCEGWTNLFERKEKEGWIGADGIFTVGIGEEDTLCSAKSSTKTLITFQDTWEGKTDKDGKISYKQGMLHHSIAIFNGNVPLDEKLEFKSQLDCLQSKDGYQYWINDGVHMGDALYYLVMEVEENKLNPNGVHILKIPVKDKEPILEKSTLEKADHLFHDGKDGHVIMMGSGILSYSNDKTHIYIYGYRCDKVGIGPKNLVVAKIDTTNFSRALCFGDKGLEFWDGKDWKNSIDEINNDNAHLKSNVSCELSVTYMNKKVFKNNPKYMLVYTKDVESPVLEYALAERPQGPFKEGIPFYICPEYEGISKGNIYTYNAKAHPHLSNPGSLLVSYNVNLKGIEIIDNSIYRPRFVEINISKYALDFFPKLSKKYYLKSAASVKKDQNGKELAAQYLDGRDDQSTEIPDTVLATWKHEAKYPDLLAWNITRIGCYYTLKSISSNKWLSVSDDLNQRLILVENGNRENKKIQWKIKRMHGHYTLKSVDKGMYLDRKEQKTENFSNALSISQINKEKPGDWCWDIEADS